jgi:predicted DNA-binding transcriptional regulator AlpA
VKNEPVRERPSLRPRLGDRGKDLMTVAEVAFVSGMGIPASYDLVREGVIPSIKIGKRATYVPRNAYWQWLETFEPPRKPDAIVRRFASLDWGEYGVGRSL